MNFANRNGSFVTGLLTGALVGASLAMILTPLSGGLTEGRERLSEPDEHQTTTG